MSLFSKKQDDYETLPPDLQVLYLKKVLEKSSEEFFKCELTDEEWIEFLELKNRLSKRITEVVDEELKNSIYKIKTGKSL